MPFIFPSTYKYKIFVLNLPVSSVSCSEVTMPSTDFSSWSLLDPNFVQTQLTWSYHIVTCPTPCDHIRSRIPRASPLLCICVAARRGISCPEVFGASNAANPQVWIWTQAHPWSPQNEPHPWGCSPPLSLSTSQACQACSIWYSGLTGRGLSYAGWVLLGKYCRSCHR